MILKMRYTYQPHGNKMEAQACGELLHDTQQKTHTHTHTHTHKYVF